MDIERHRTSGRTDLRVLAHERVELRNCIRILCQTCPQQQRVVWFTRDHLQVPKQK